MQSIIVFWNAEIQFKLYAKDCTLTYCRGFGINTNIHTSMANLTNGNISWTIFVYLCKNMCVDSSKKLNEQNALPMYTSNIVDLHRQTKVINFARTVKMCHSWLSRICLVWVSLQFQYTQSSHPYGYILISLGGRFGREIRRSYVVLSAARARYCRAMAEKNAFI
jgi:hypothetical protein